MICGVNVFIVLLELAIVYPECINTKTRTASCVRSLMSRNARDDKNGRFGERAPQLTILAKLAILAIFCQFRQIS